MTATAEIISQAIAQVQLGFAAFALGINSKKPVTLHGFKDATTDPTRIQSQLTLPVAGNYGITWPPEREPVVVLDLDNGEDGRERPWQDRLVEQIDRIGPLPPTKSTTTPSGGRHAFYRWPASVPLPGGDELFGFTARWPGRGYLVGPGSSIDGIAYLPGPVTEIVDLPPPWVAAAMSEHTPRQARGGSFVTVGGSHYELPERITSGQRYSTIRDYVASRYNAGLPLEELWDLVRAQVAPRFTQPLGEGDLRDRFDRAVAKLSQRLGPPRHGPQIPAGPLEVAPLTDFDSRPVEWVWSNWLPRAVVTVMDGNPGVSKSTVVADLVARLSVAAGWPDETPMERPLRTLWITTEDDPGRVLRPRIEAAGGDPRLVLFVRSEVVFPTVAGAFTELLVQLAAEPDGLGLAVLDPLFSHIEATVRTIADAEMRRGVMNPLAASAEASNAAILVVRHFNKDATASAINRGAGSLGGIVGAARALWTVTADPESDDDDAKVVGVSKMSYARTPPALRYKVVDRLPPGWISGSVSGIEWLGAAPISITAILTETAESKEAQPVLAELLRNGPLAANTVFAQMRGRGYGRAAVRTAKARLGIKATKQGMFSGWTWQLPDTEESEEFGRADASPFADSSGIPPENGSEPRARAHAGAGAGTARAHASSDSSKSTKGLAGGRPPQARARARDEEPTSLHPVESESAWLHPCRRYATHRNHHRQTAAGWTCDACHPEGASS